jgi:hypothetical protein
MNFFEKMLAIDRRWIFLVMAAVMIAPFFFYIGLPIKVTPEVQALYDAVEKLKPGDVVVYAGEYDPATIPELQPMAQAFLRHAFSKGVKIIATGLFQLGVAQVEQDLTFVANEMGKKRGVDYVFLGYKPYPETVILNMGENFRKVFATDYYGNPTDSSPMMKGIKNYSDCKLIVSINATSGADYWIRSAHGRYNIPLGLGVTAVMATDYYSYLQSGQIFALVGGMKGAAEYERLAGFKEKKYLRATARMDILSFGHLAIILFVILGNIAFFASRRKK